MMTGTAPKRTGAHLFKKGMPRPANAGRKKGSKNIVNQTVKEALIKSFNTIGADKFFTKLARSKSMSNQRAMAQIYSKLLPIELTGANGGPLQTQNDTTMRAQISVYLPDNGRNAANEQKNALPAPAVGRLVSEVPAPPARASGPKKAAAKHKRSTKKK